MSVQYGITSGVSALVAATTKLVVSGTTDGSGPPPEWISCEITFNGVTAGAVPVLAEFCTYATAGTGGAATTPRKLGAAIGTARSTWRINDTTDGGTPVVLFSWYLPPTMPFFYQWPLGRELLHPVSTIQGIRLTAPAAVSCVVNLSIEE